MSERIDPESRLKLFLQHVLKPEEITGEDREVRVDELLGWFERYLNGDANPKWVKSHIAELCHYISSLERELPPFEYVNSFYDHEHNCFTFDLSKVPLSSFTSQELGHKFRQKLGLDSEWIYLTAKKIYLNFGSILTSYSFFDGLLRDDRFNTKAEFLKLYEIQGHSALKQTFNIYLDRMFRL